MNEIEDDKTDRTSMFEGDYWKKVKSPGNIDIVYTIFWIIFVFPFLVLVTEKSRGNRIEIGTQELFGFTFLTATFLAYFVSYGESQDVFLGLLISTLLGAIAGGILGLITGRATWVLFLLSAFAWLNLLAVISLSVIARLIGSG